MKKITSFVLLIITIAVYGYYTIYTKTDFDYHVAQTIGYFFYWTLDLLVISLLAASLDIARYKTWRKLSLLYVIISIAISIYVGDSNGAIISFDGKDLTWFFASIYSIVSLVYFGAIFLGKEKLK